MPFLSQSAGGNFTENIYYSSYGVRTVVKQLVTPSNPRTAKQQANRESVSALTSFWGIFKHITAAINSYKLLNKFHRYNLPAYHAYLKIWMTDYNKYPKHCMVYQLGTLQQWWRNIGPGQWRSEIKFYAYGASDDAFTVGLFSIGKTPACDEFFHLLSWAGNPYGVLESFAIPFSERPIYIKIVSPDAPPWEDYESLSGIWEVDSFEAHP